MGIVRDRTNPRKESSVFRKYTRKPKVQFAGSSESRHRGKEAESVKPR